MRITSNTSGRQLDVNFVFGQRRLSRYSIDPVDHRLELDICDSRTGERLIREERNRTRSEQFLGEQIPSQFQEALRAQNYRPTSVTDTSMGQLGLENPDAPEDDSTPDRPPRGLPDDLPERPPRTPTPPPRPPRRDPPGRRPSVPPPPPRPPRNPGGGYN